VIEQNKIYPASKQANMHRERESDHVYGSVSDDLSILIGHIQQQENQKQFYWVSSNG